MSRYLSSYGEAVEESKLTEFLKTITGRKGIINFANGLPDPSTFPIEIKELINEILEERRDEALQYSNTCGLVETKEAIIKLMELRGVYGVREDEICVTNGAQEALFILFTLILDRYDRVVVEKPTYLATLETLKPLSPTYIGLEITDEGYNFKKMRSELKGKKAKLFYLIPTAQNPSGMSMPDEDKKEVMDAAKMADSLIVEDDAYGFLQYFDLVKPLKAIDDENRVIYVGSFSKILSSGMRLGWIVAPSFLIKKIEGLKQNINAHTSTLLQMVASLSIEKGILQRNLDKVRLTYLEKRNVMIKTMEEKFSSEVKFTKPKGGMFIFVWFPPGIDSSILLERSSHKGVVFFPGKYFYFDNGGTNSARFNFSSPKIEEIRRGIELLSDIIQEIRAIK